VIEERHSFDLENEEVIGVIGGVLLDGLDGRGEDGPLKLQHAVPHVHLAQVPEVVCPHVAAERDAV